MPSNDRRWIDLHLHSTASDGAYAPSRLMEMAQARQLSAVALTDHDSISGLAEGAAAAQRLGMEFVTGVELSATHGRGALHILGYFFDPDAPAMRDALAWVVEQRTVRNLGIIDRLRSLGVELDYEAICAEAETEAIGRPHIAHALVRKGVVATFRDAFKKYLADGAAAWVGPAQFTAEKVIDIIHASGGVATLAHPSQLGYASHLELATLLRRFVDAGLDAIEVYHPDHTDAQSKLYIELSRKLGLAQTGGSDFHALGTCASRGAGFGTVRVPYEFLTALRSRVDR